MEWSELHAALKEFTDSGRQDVQFFATHLMAAIEKAHPELVAAEMAKDVVEEKLNKPE